MYSQADHPRALAVYFSSDGLIASVSPEAEQVMGYRSVDLLGRPVSQILAEPAALELHRMMEAALEWGAWDGEVTHLTRHGRRIPMQSRLLSMSCRTDTRSDFLLVSAVRDLVGATPAERELLGEMNLRLRSLVHEINNPLAVVMGFTQLILLNQQCSGKVRTDVERLYAELGRVSHAVEKLHKLALLLRKEQESAVPVLVAAGGLKRA